LKKTIRSVLDVLDSKERKILWLQSAGDIVISLSDIIFVTGLVMMIASFAGGGNIFKTYLPAGQWNEKPLLLSGFFLFAYAVKNIVAVLLLKKQYAFYYAVAGRISMDNLDYYLQSEYQEYVKTDSSVYTRKISQQPVEFAHYVLRSVQQLITQTILVILATGLLAVFNTRLFLLLALFLVPPFIFCFYFLRKKESAIRSDIKQFSERSLQYLREALSGFVENKIYAKTRFFSNRYSKYQQKLNHVLAGRQVLQGSSSRVIEIFALLALFILIAIKQNSTFAISSAAIGAFMGAAYKIIPGVVKIMNSFAQVKAYSFSIEKNIPRNTTTLPAENQLHIESLQFKNVSFSFGETVMLNNVSLNLNKGDIAGITGFSGKGKTTLINLLLGFLEPASGEILINNSNVSDVKTYAWERISYVKQQAFLINDSALKNITLSDNGVDKEKYFKVIGETGLADADFSDIYENGRNISGGQRQRVAFARALYKDFDLLILDEPFSELDHEAEITMLNQLHGLSKQGKIVVLITHNAQALSYCNKILSVHE
jgi:ABC-type multidrug transport system fused ATPase/permease subunit